MDFREHGCDPKPPIENDPWASLNDMPFPTDPVTSRAKKSSCTDLGRLSTTCPREEVLSSNLYKLRTIAERLAAK